MTLTIQDAIAMLGARGSGIVFLSEAGSRAWGTAGPYSDHDLIAVTVQPLADYAALVAPEASIKLADTPDLSLVTFDVRQALTMTANGNPYFGERCNTLVHHSIPEIRDEFQAYAERCFDPYSAMRCWAKEGMAAFQGRVDRDPGVEPRRYMNLLRPTLAVNRYLGGVPGLPPADLLELASQVDVPNEISDILEKLVDICRAGEGKIRVPRVNTIESYFEATFKTVMSAKETGRKIPELKQKLDEGTALVLKWTGTAFDPEMQPCKGV